MPPHRLLFPISTAFGAPVVEHWLERDKTLDSPNTHCVSVTSRLENHYNLD